jgi:hypothetical protein
LLSQILLDVGLLEPQGTNARKSCQGGKRDEIFVSDCEQGKNNRDYILDTNEDKMKNAISRDRTGYAKLETKELAQVKTFLEQNATKLETAELSVRSSAGNYIAELRPIEDPKS